MESSSAGAAHPTGVTGYLSASPRSLKQGSLSSAVSGARSQGDQTSVTKIITRVTEDLAVWKKRFVLRNAGTADSIQAWLLYLNECKHSPHVPVLPPVTTVSVTNV